MVAIRIALAVRTTPVKWARRVLLSYVAGFAFLTVLLFVTQALYPDREILTSPRTLDYTETAAAWPVYLLLSALPFAMFVVPPLAFLSGRIRSRAGALMGVIPSLLPALVLFETALQFLCVALLHLMLAASLPAKRGERWLKATDQSDRSA